VTLPAPGGVLPRGHNFPTGPRPGVAHHRRLTARAKAQVRVGILVEAECGEDKHPRGRRRSHDAPDGPAGLEQVLASDYDVVVLDRDLPGMHGDDVCARLVASRCRGRVLMLTAAAQAGLRSRRPRPPGGAAWLPSRRR
jgi:CheY-like chemotaxis protein